MSKKKSKSKNKNKARAMMGYGYGHNSNKKDKGNKPTKREIKVLKHGKHLDASLSKKDVKKLHKFALQYPEMPDSIKAIRAECNHATDTISVAEYQSLPNHYNPTTDIVIESFGDSVQICKHCYEAMLDKSDVSEANVRVSIATLIGAINYITPRVKMSSKELTKHYEMKNKLMNMLGVITDELKEAYERDEAYAAADEIRRNMSDRAAHQKMNRQNNQQSYKPSQVTNLNNGFVRSDEDDESEE